MVNELGVVVWINYPYRVVYIRFIGTHRQYDKLTLRQCNEARSRPMNVAPIKTKRDYRRALKEIEGLMHARRGAPEGDRLDVLVTLVEARRSIIRSRRKGGAA